jgi:hypothetical protein
MQCCPALCSLWDSGGVSLDSYATQWRTFSVQGLQKRRVNTRQASLNGIHFLSNLLLIPHGSCVLYRTWESICGRA